jgi:hypothetical protein
VQGLSDHAVVMREIIGQHLSILYDATTALPAPGSGP